MDLNEKIQKLRKQNKLTQVQLAEKLFVSRTAVSKWESGRGYPSIDILKQISNVFNISLDNLLSNDQILELASIDKRNNMKKIYNCSFGILDILIIIFVILPLYGKTVDNYIYSVSLLSTNNLLGYIKAIYFISFLTIFGLGIIEIFICNIDKEKTQKVISFISLIFHFILVCFVVVTNEPYVCSLLLIILAIKTILYFKNLKNYSNI